MSNSLTISIGQYSDKGCKPINQDFHGALIPPEPQLSAKGIALALADGIGSSNVSQIASEAAVRGFLEDYYCTSDAWTVKTSAQRVLTATNSWLHAQTQQSQYRFDKDRGYVCTLSAAIFKAATVHLFHIGDSRIYRLAHGAFEQLTSDHRVQISAEQHYLSRALGIAAHIEIDYRTLDIECGDIFVLTTDGIHEFVDARSIAAIVAAHGDDLNAAAQAIAAEALQRGSDDNLTVQIARIDALPRHSAGEVCRQLSRLPLPPPLRAGQQFDGYTIVRELHSSHRSHLYLAQDNDTGARVAIKIPSIDLRGDAAYLENFLMEEWIARRIDNVHVMKAQAPARARNYLYTVLEYIEGQTLAQWMVDHPRPSLAAVRGIVEQIAKGLRAFHRAEMLHRDLRPENIVIDHSGTAKIIDFGSTRVAGIAEAAASAEQTPVPGALSYAAPEYFLGEGGSARADIFSLAVIAYQMLSGRLPYGAEVAKCRSRAAQSKLIYRSVLARDREIPAWIDDVLKKALQINPLKRYQALSEFVYDLSHPRREFLDKARPPLIERNPLLFWKAISIILFLIVLLLIGNR